MNRKAALLKKFGRSLRAENGSAFAQAYLAAELVRMAVPEKHSKQELMDAIRETAIDLFGQFGGSPDKYENRAKAGLLYDWLKSDGELTKYVRYYRRTVDMTAWETVARAWLYHGLGVADCLAYLQAGESTSVEGLKRQIERSHTKNYPARVVVRYVNRAQRGLQDMWSDLDGEKIDAKGRDILRAIGDHIEDVVELGKEYEKYYESL